MTIQIGFLVFPQMQQLDLTGPYEVFASSPSAAVHLIWKNRDTVCASTGLDFKPTMTFEECSALDVFCIPGGGGINALLQDTAVIDFVRAQAARTRYMTSVCSGSLVLGAAGLLRGRRATTHWMSHDFLPVFGAIPVQARIVRDGNLITAGGVTAGIDFGLFTLAELVAPEEAEAIQLALEYAPAPPFSSGTPETASREVIAMVRERLAPARNAREAVIAELARTMKLPD